MQTGWREGLDLLLDCPQHLRPGLPPATGEKRHTPKKTASAHEGQTHRKAQSDRDFLSDRSLSTLSLPGLVRRSQLPSMTSEDGPGNSQEAQTVQQLRGTQGLTGSFKLRTAVCVTLQTWVQRHQSWNRLIDSIIFRQGSVNQHH